MKILTKNRGKHTTHKSTISSVLKIGKAK